MAVYMIQTPIHTVQFEAFATEQLKQHGYRITQPRKAIMAFFASTDAPYSAYEIQAAMAAQGTAMDTVTIYRTLECFETLHLLHRVPSGSRYVRCHTQCSETNKAHARHYLLVCERCDDITEISDSIPRELLRHLENTTGFSLGDKAIEVRGECASCQS